MFDTELPSAVDLGRELVQRVLAVIRNGLGSTKHGELFVLWRTVAPLLREAGYTLVMHEVGVELARRLAKEWIGYAFDPSPGSAAKVKVLSDLADC